MKTKFGLAASTGSQRPSRRKLLELRPEAAWFRTCTESLKKRPNTCPQPVRVGLSGGVLAYDDIVESPIMAILIGGSLAGSAAAIITINAANDKWRVGMGILSRGGGRFCALGT